MEIVDSAGEVGRYTALTLDADGHAAIAYHDTTNDDLKLARWNVAGWDVETVDSDGDGGERTSLALDAAGRPAITYIDSTNREMKYARWDGSLWTIQAVASSTMTAGGTASLALDNGDSPVISFCHVSCETARVTLARRAVDALLYRGVVDTLEPGWRPAALPLSDANDVALAPFPVETAFGEWSEDAIVEAAPLTLYRLLGDGTEDTGNRLRAVRRVGGVELRY